MSFNFSTFDPSKYGLTKTDKQGSPDDGIINDGRGNYYKIDGFERQQKDDLDTDVLGKSAGLEGLAKKHTDFSVTTFNTGSDVQKALQHLADSGSETVAPVERRMSWNEAVEGRHLSQNVLDAIDRTTAFKNNLNDRLMKLKGFEATPSTEMTDEAKAQMTNKISDKVSATMQEKY